MRKRKAILGLAFEKERWETLEEEAREEDAERVALRKRERSSRSSAMEMCEVSGCLRGRIWGPYKKKRRDREMNRANE